MTPDDYRATQDALVKAALDVARLDLPAFLDALATAETCGPILDPTLYRKAAPNLERVARLARAATGIRNELLGQIREGLEGVAELAGLTDEELLEISGARR